MRVVSALAILSTATLALFMATPVRAAPADWTQTCDTVSHFAELVSAARDEGHPAGSAALVARQILGNPGVVSPDVAAEITRQVYTTPRLSPSEEAASFRNRCLTPVAAELAPINLDVGVNHVDTPEGTLDLDLAWKDDGNGHGHDVFMATMQGAPVAMPGGAPIITDDPADDEDMRRSVRFAQERTDGANTILLLVAQRESGDGATETTYQVFHLVRDAEGYRFTLLDEQRLPRGFCNADAALSVASGLALRKSYRGSHTLNGCPAMAARNP